MTTPFELMVAPTGARLSKADHAGLPITIAEIAAEAKSCADAGATALHLHVRDAAGLHSLDPEIYNRAIAAVQAKTSIPIQFSTEAAGIFDTQTQRTCLAHTKAHDASVALREMTRDPDHMGQVYTAMVAAKVDVQHILYSPQEVTQLLELFERQVIPRASARVIFVLGRYHPDQRSTPADLQPFLKAMAQASLRWMVCAFGPLEQDCLLAALDQGGDARIGFENNRIAPDGRVFPDNASSVASFVKRAAAAGFTPQRRT